jgi:CheY-like chemotaxis protein
MRRLLAIDDMPDSAELVVRSAMRCGYDAMSLTVLSGVSEVVTRWKPDVVTLDLCMPETDGIGFLSVLHEAGFCGELLIISGQNEKVRKAAVKIAALKGMRVIGDLEKPVQLTRLRALLSTAAAAA